MKVLVVEDEPVSLKLAHLVLTLEGHHVSGAQSAEQAFDAISESQPEIILLDLALPGMDGLALARKLKEHEETRKIPVVAVTSHPELFSRAEAFRAGCDAYIIKPIDTRRLPSQITAIARDHSAQE